MGGVALFGLDPGFLMLGQIGIMGEVGMGGVGSSTMELIGGTLLRGYEFLSYRVGKSSSRSSVSFVSLGLVNLVVCYLGCGQLQHVCKNDKWKTFFILLRYDITTKRLYIGMISALVKCRISILKD